MKKEPRLQPPKYMVNTQIEGQKEDQNKKVKPYKLPALYPERLAKQEYVQKFTKFLETFTDLVDDGFQRAFKFIATATLFKFITLENTLLCHKDKVQR